MNELINIIAEQLINEFPGIEIKDVIGKATRLYTIMKLEKSLEEIQKERDIKDLKKNIKMSNEQKADLLPSAPVAENRMLCE